MPNEGTNWLTNRWERVGDALKRAGAVERATLVVVVIVQQQQHQRLLRRLLLLGRPRRRYRLRRTICNKQLHILAPDEATTAPARELAIVVVVSLASQFVFASERAGICCCSITRRRADGRRLGSQQQSHLAFRLIWRRLRRRRQQSRDAVARHCTPKWRREPRAQLGGASSAKSALGPVGALAPVGAHYSPPLPVAIRPHCWRLGASLRNLALALSAEYCGRDEAPFC